MKLSQFIVLDIDMKGKLLLHEGIFLEKRRYGLFLAFLFQMDNFYVEMRCNTKTRQVEEYRIFLLIVETDIRDFFGQCFLQMTEIVL